MLHAHSYVMYVCMYGPYEGTNMINMASTETFVEMIGPLTESMKGAGSLYVGKK